MATGRSMALKLASDAVSGSIGVVSVGGERTAAVCSIARVVAAVFFFFVFFFFFFFFFFFRYHHLLPIQSTFFLP